jgi:hypothetical protein
MDAAAVGTLEWCRRKRALTAEIDKAIEASGEKDGGVIAEALLLALRGWTAVWECERLLGAAKG